MSSTPQDNCARDEKLHAIAAVFGPEVAARFRTPNMEAQQAVDPDRLAWQRSRLIQHLREKSATVRKPAPSDDHPDPSADTPPSPLPALERLRIAARLDRLGGEHPAVIAHILKTEPQKTRVAVLRDLPGGLARHVMRRLR
jgi:hypothetical protein